MAANESTPTTASDAPTRVALVRHGQTAWNRDDRFRGRIEMELTELGLAQAEAAADCLAALPIAAVYASPLRRAVQTAQAIAVRHGLAVATVDGLVDVDYGGWVGLSAAEAAAQYPEAWQLWLHQPQDLCFPGGECIRDVRQRAVAAVESLAARHRGQTIVLVSHRVICVLLACHSLGLDESHLWHVEQDVAAVNHLELRNGCLVALHLNDTCHLRATA